MPFDSSVVTRIYPPVPLASGTRLSWEATSPSGTIFQVYVAGKLVYANPARTCVFPTTRGNARIEVGAVGSSEKDVDFSASLTVAPLNRAEITWTGGPSLGADLSGFHVYQGPSPGAAIDYTRPVATIPAYAGGAPVSGVPESTYSWTSPPLLSGAWSFGVKSFDVNGNEGAAMEGTVGVTAAPLPPARGDDGDRLRYTYDHTTGLITLSWLASPG